MDKREEEAEKILTQMMSNCCIHKNKETKNLITKMNEKQCVSKRERDKEREKIF